MTAATATRASARESLRAAFEDHYRPLVRFCALVSGDRGTGEDLAQEAFVRIVDRIERVEEARVGAYLRRTAVNVWKNRLRRIAVERAGPGPEPRPPGDLGLTRVDPRSGEPIGEPLPRDYRGFAGEHGSIGTLVVGDGGVWLWGFPTVDSTHGVIYRLDAAALEIDASVAPEGTWMMRPWTPPPTPCGSRTTRTRSPASTCAESRRHQRGTLAGFPLVQAIVRLEATAALAFLLLAGCQASAPTTETRRDAGEGATPSGRPAPSFDGWTIRVSVRPHTVGPIEIAVGSLRSAPETDSHPWIRHEMTFRNRGDRLVRFHDTRTSGFIRRAGRPVLLVADEGCGYEKRRRKPVRPGACLLYLDEFMVRPGSAARRTITLFRELRGMEPLAPGTYAWDKVIRFRVGSPDAPVRTATIRLTYELSRAGG